VSLFLSLIAHAICVFSFSNLSLSSPFRHAASAAGAAGEVTAVGALLISQVYISLVTRWQVQSAGVQNEPLNRALTDLRRML
jgi:hypothetical protein